MGLTERIPGTIFCLILFIFLFSFTGKVYSQDSVKIIKPGKIIDSTKSKVHKDSLAKPMNYFVLKGQYQYMNQTQPDTISRKRFLWYPLKEIEEVFNFLPGYYLKYMDVGQRQNIDYNSLDGSYTGVLRFGRPINDLLDGSFDLNMLSRNEIDEFELSDGFGDFPYDFSNGVNVIQRQLAGNKPYSEIAYWQDRNNNLSLDADFHQNIFRKFNFNFGITKHSYDGEYLNSDFDKWLGRFNFNFAFSNKVNAFLYANYSRIQRGLNNGLNPDTIDINNTSIVFDPTKAIVQNSDAYEIRERFDIDLGLMMITSKDSTSYAKIQFFESNAYRKYADEENRPNPNGIFLIDRSHWIDYGVKFQNLYNFNLSRQVRVQSNTEGEFDLDLMHTNYNPLRQSARIFLFENIGLKIRNLFLNSFIKGFAYEYYSSKFEYNYGINGKYLFGFDSVTNIGVKASYQRVIKLPTYMEYFVNTTPPRTELQELKAGIEAKNKIGRLSVDLYNNKKTYPGITAPYANQTTVTGIASSVFLRLFKFDVEGTYQENLKTDISFLNAFTYNIQEPKYTGNASVSFHDMAFNNKLEYKIGFNSRVWSKYYADFYTGLFNSFSNTMPNGESILIPANGTLDFYIIAKINKATFGLTLENLFNRILFTTGVYPYMNRGGLFNVISRFNITWYFLN